MDCANIRGGAEFRPKDAKLDSEVSELRFRLLGPLEAERGGITLELGPRKQRAVLALLLLEANRVVPTERLIDELWGDAAGDGALGAAGVRRRAAQGARGRRRSLHAQAPGYVLDLEPGALDLQAFAALRAEARDRRAARAADALHEALALWRGAPLAELDGAPFAQAPPGPSSRSSASGALEERIDADLALGRHADLIHELDALVAEHPYRERFRAQQMLALYRSGRQADALAAYRSARETFVEGLGIEPGAELKALERQVLDQDPASRLRQPLPARSRSPPGRRPPDPRGRAARARRRRRGRRRPAPRRAGRAHGRAELGRGDRPETNDVVGAVPAGVEPGPIASVEARSGSATSPASP